MFTFVCFFFHFCSRLFSVTFGKACHTDTMKTVFVTVGTTSFDDLIGAVTSDESVKALIDRGYTDMVLQVGRGSVVPDPDSCPGMTLKVFHFKDSIAEDMRHSDLVISHAGAGSCLEALGANKALLVVVNDKLMDNHQLELAKQLQADSHLIYCTCSALPQTLRDMDLSALTTYVPGQPQNFANFLDKAVGLV
ncbi:UDP-N-acetylglucosamine transferase subunit ALG13 homolog [Sinocyclocheilus anshuiensis]|uniref:UDP-N-acetylglucosamine transferase subunit ALG13 n=1 Tax=Sinocyclocheilus anshuiensis TaxID=1608454 RepID=A0A671NI88_9TELE|nr:PREDICTED: UDP-N-acetylglucosamine transferase subunit ALG13 homolog [Sinocyclocheilus anshuiensis]